MGYCSLMEQGGLDAVLPGIPVVHEVVIEPDLRPHLQDLPGRELFQFLDVRGKRQVVSSDDVNAYLREATGHDFSAKDFRTWGGTMHAALALRAMGPPATRREADRNILRASSTV